MRLLRRVKRVLCAKKNVSQVKAAAQSFLWRLAALTRASSPASYFLLRLSEICIEASCLLNARSNLCCATLISRIAWRRSGNNHHDMSLQRSHSAHFIRYFEIASSSRRRTTSGPVQVLELRRDFVRKRGGSTSLSTFSTLPEVLRSSFTLAVALKAALALKDALDSRRSYRRQRRGVDASDALG